MILYYTEVNVRAGQSPTVWNDFKSTHSELVLFLPEASAYLLKAQALVKALGLPRVVKARVLLQSMKSALF
jgi:hypothetical protein